MKQYKSLIVIGVALAIIAGYIGGQEVSRTLSIEIETPVIQEIEAIQYSPMLSTAKNDYFAASGVCSACHMNLQDQQGNDISFEALWRSSSMANSARDPYFLATVRSEITHLPELRETIEDSCATCHMSMSRFSDFAEGRVPQILDKGGYLSLDYPNHELALDGVSCKVCHQIRDENFGQESSYSGGMSFNLTKSELRTIFGPRPAEPAVVMEASGFSVVQSDHVRESELCGTCHTLYTPFVTSDGSVAGTLFPEQTPYLEWLESDYVSTDSCQDCHMPKTEGAAQISNISANKYDNVTTHTFVGGNVVLLEMLRSNANEIQPNAGIEHLDVSILETKSMIAEQTAQITIENVEQGHQFLSFDVNIRVETGHKFPSAYPSRRAWLHVVVTDAHGEIIFESGKLDGASIVGNDNDADESLYEPHFDLITNPDQVQVYEAILGTDTGEVTTTLLEAAQYLKDNRLLPVGFDKVAVEEDVAVYGKAQADDTFTGGGDVIRFEIPADGEEYAISASLLYQPIGYRWAHNFEKERSEEALAFLGYFNDLPTTSLLVDEDVFQTTP